MELDVENLDKPIVFWRKKKKEAKEKSDDTGVLIGSCYVDAFQTVRVNHGIPLLPSDIE